MGNNDQKIKILIIDNSIAEREILKQTFSSINDIEVVGVVPNGHIGLIKIQNSQPDIIILDTNIKGMTSPEFTTQALLLNEQIGIFLTTDDPEKQENIKEIIKCLEIGAIDFIKNPEKNLNPSDIDPFLQKLLALIRVYSIQKYSRLAKQVSKETYDVIHKNENNINYELQNITNNENAYNNPGNYKALLIGVSTGGPKALSRIIPFLPQNFPLPVIIVIHLPKLFTNSLAQDLNKQSKLNVKEVTDNDIIKRGNVYIAKGGKHLIIKKTSDLHLVIDDTEPILNCKPSVDLLFKSAIPAFNGKVISILLTGMGNDGVEGMSQLKETGAMTIVQDKETSIVWGMPGSAVEKGVVDEILPLDRIIVRIIEVIS